MCKGRQVKDASIHRRVVNLEVAGVDYGPKGGADGNPRAAFTPDFYLSDHDLYLEVTTLRQSLVTRKNRKVRQLREQQPDIQVRILYQRDIERLFATHAA